MIPVEAQPGAAPEAATPDSNTGTGFATTGNAADGMVAAEFEMFTPAQLRVIAQDGVDKGQFSRADANADLVARGLEPLPDSAATQTDAEQLLADNAAPMDAAAYYPHMPNLGGSDPKEIEQIAKQAGTWAAAVGFSVDAFGEIARTIERVSRAGESMTEGDHALNEVKQREILARVHGNQTDQVIQHARTVVAAIEAAHPGLIDLLDRNGIGNDAIVVSLFARQHAVIEAHRAASKKAK